MGTIPIAHAKGCPPEKKGGRYKSNGDRVSWFRRGHFFPCSSGRNEHFLLRIEAYNQIVLKIWADNLFHASKPVIQIGRLAFVVILRAHLLHLRLGQIQLGLAQFNNRA